MKLLFNQNKVFELNFDVSFLPFIQNQPKSTEINRNETVILLKESLWYK